MFPSKRFFTVSIFLYFIFILHAQTKSVSGIVTDAESRAAIAYATVAIQGRDGGVVTGLDGRYVISTDGDDPVLVVSYIGMETMLVPVGDRSVVDVALLPTYTAIDELIVTALGISRDKKSLGYSSQKLSSDEVSNANPTNTMSALSGRVAGLQVQGQNFAGSQNILIRGGSSFSGNNQPLFIVDGIPISNDGFNTTEAQSGSGGYDYGSTLSDLNPNDIASIDVLKGSAASALYGARGQNGVVMISTKTGKVGKKSFSIDVNSGVTFETVSTLPVLQNSYGGGYSDVFETVDINGISYEVVAYNADESWGPKFDASKTPIHWWGMSDYEQGITAAPVTAPWVASANDVESFYQTGVSYQNSINVTSTTEKSAIRLGYTNVNTTGVVPNSKQVKNTYTLNANTAIYEDVLTLNSSITFVNTKTEGRPHFGSSDKSPSQMLFQWGQRQLDMNQLENYINEDGTQRAWNRTSYDDPTARSSDNPYWTVNKNWQDDDRTRMYGTVGLKAKLTDYLNAEGHVFVDTYTFNMRERVAIGSQEISSYKETTHQALETNYEGKLNFRKSVNDIDIMSMVGANMRTNSTSLLSGETSGGLVVSDLWNLNNSTGQVLVNDYESEKLVKSVFAMMSLGWRNMAYVDGTYRVDFDSSLPNANNSYGYFSVSGSFIASELIEWEALNMLKGRINYGETGNGTDPYQIDNTYISNTSFNGTPSFSNNTTLSHPDLLPEKTQEIELGLEASLLNHRLGVDFSWYNRTTSNQIVPMEISGAVGYTNRIVNVGAINNKGIELMLSGTPVKLRHFSWDITLNFAKNINLVQDLPDGLDKIELASADYAGAILNAEKGATFQELYGYDYVYDNDGNKVINPQTGFYEQGEFHSLGSVLPDYTAGLFNRFKYKNIDLSILFDTSQGGVYYSLSNAFGMYSGMLAETAMTTSNGNTIREDGIVVDGVLVSRNENGEITSSSANNISISAQDYGHDHFHVFNTPSASTFYDASYIKLREISLGIAVPSPLEYIKNLHVSVYGRNLAVWGLGYKGTDPETIVGGNGNIQGFEAGVTPGTASYGFNVKLSF